METAIGVVAGVIVTILVSRYYFLRSVDKSIGVYKILDTFVFDGIAPDFRKLLNFRFKDKEVSDLQQLIFLIANDGERAISHFIQPLNLILPRPAEVLDASIIHVHPEKLEAKILLARQENSDTQITTEFPLLNKGEFFVVKLLISGRVNTKKIKVTVLADDLPRDIKIKPLPEGALAEGGYKFEWELAIASLAILVFPAWIFFSMYMLWTRDPGLFPFPWGSYTFSMSSFFIYAPGFLLGGIFTLFGLVMLISSAFSGEFPPSRKPHFPIPKEMHGAIFSYRRIHFSPNLSADGQGKVLEEDL